MNNIYADKYVLRDEEQWNELFEELIQNSNIEGLTKDKVKNGILVNQDSDNDYYIVTIEGASYKIKKDLIQNFFVSQNNKY